MRVFTSQSANSTKQGTITINSTAMVAQIHVHDTKQALDTISCPSNCALSLCHGSISQTAVVMT